MEEDELYFAFASVVFVTSKNTPQTFRREWLEHQEIFGDDVSVVQSVETPPVIKIEYSNGFTFEANPERSEIKISLDYETDEDEKTEALEDLVTYATNFGGATRYLPYDAVGLNYKIAVRSDGIENLTTGLPNGVQPRELEYALSVDDFTTKVRLETGTLTTTGDQVVVFAGNFHYELAEYEDHDNRFETIADIVDQLQYGKTQLEELVYDTNL